MCRCKSSCRCAGGACSSVKDASGESSPVCQGEGVKAKSAEPTQPYLEYREKTVGERPQEDDDKDERMIVHRVRHKMEAIKCGCKSWFCPTCAVGQGVKFRERLMKVLETFEWVQMWTLTVDPSLYESEKECYLAVKGQRMISELMRALKERGYLATGRFIYFVEWHKSGWPHFHLLVDSKFIPHSVVKEIWNSNRPADAGPVLHAESCDCIECGGIGPVKLRPAFGSVRFSKGQFNSVFHAACYATKYLTKYPEHGYPRWVLECNTRVIRRYGVSRGFWGEMKARKEPKGRTSTKSERRVIDQLQDCGREVAVVQHETVYYSDQTVEHKRRFVALGNRDEKESTRRFMKRCGLDPDVKCQEISPEQAEMIITGWTGGVRFATRAVPEHVGKTPAPVVPFSDDGRRAA